MGTGLFHRWFRVGLVVLLLVLLLPIASAGLASLTTDAVDDGANRTSAQNVTFISSQGGSSTINPKWGSLVAVHTDTKKYSGNITGTVVTMMLIPLMIREFFL